MVITNALRLAGREMNTACHSTLRFGISRYHVGCSFKMLSQGSCDNWMMDNIMNVIS